MDDPKIQQNAKSTRENSKRICYLLYIAFMAYIALFFDPDNRPFIVDIIGLVILLGCPVKIAELKGYPYLLGVIGLIPLLGILIIFLLPDKNAQRE